MKKLKETAQYNQKHVAWQTDLIHTMLAKILHRFTFKSLQHLHFSLILSYKTISLQSKQTLKWKFQKVKAKYTLKAFEGSGGMPIAGPVIWSCMMRDWSAAKNTTSAASICQENRPGLRHIHEKIPPPKNQLKTAKNPLNKTQSRLNPSLASCSINN